MAQSDVLIGMLNVRDGTPGACQPFARDGDGEPLKWEEDRLLRQRYASVTQQLMTVGAGAHAGNSNTQPAGSTIPYPPNGVSRRLSTLR